MAGDAISGFLVDGPDARHIYLPTHASSQRAQAMLIRGRADREPSPDTLQQLFRRTGADPELFEALPLAELRDLQMYPLLAASWIGTLLGAVALALNISGLYGVLVYTFAQRTREIGIRMALGATAGAILQLVMRQSARLAGVGAFLGAAVAFAALQAIASVVRLQAVTVVDAVAFGGGAAVMLLATALAAFQPARRATRVEPAVALRADT